MSLSHFSQTSSSLKEAWPIKMVQQLGSSQNGSSSTSFPCSLLCLQQPFMPSVVHSCKNALHSQKLFLNSLENWLILLFEIFINCFRLECPISDSNKGGTKIFMTREQKLDKFEDSNLGTNIWYGWEYLFLFVPFFTNKVCLSLPWW